MSDDEGFLSRWSRRKRLGSEEDESAASDPSDSSLEEPDATAGSDRPSDETEEEVLARLGLPDPDTLERGDDFSRYLAAAVPDAIRRRALRRLWRSNPTLAVLDGLNDYDDDFRGGFVAPGTLRTAYQVGRGIVARTEEVADEIAQEITSAEESDDGAAGKPEDAALADAGDGGGAAKTPDKESRDCTPSDTGLPRRDSPEGTEAPCADGAAEPQPAHRAPRRMAFRTPDGE